MEERKILVANTRGFFGLTDDKDWNSITIVLVWTNS